MKYLKNTSLIFVLLLLFPVYAYSHNPGVHIPGEAEVREQSSIKKSCPIKRVSQQTLAIWRTMDGKGLSCPNLPLMFFKNGKVVKYPSYIPMIFKGKLIETVGVGLSSYGYRIIWGESNWYGEGKTALRTLKLNIRYEWDEEICDYQKKAEIKCKVYETRTDLEEEKKKRIEWIIDRSLILSDN